jgi:hypothetical protein
MQNTTVRLAGATIAEKRLRTFLALFVLNPF